MALVAKATGWSEAELLSMPEGAFNGYLDAALRLRGVDPDAITTVVGDAPPPAGGVVTLEPAVQSVVDQYLARS